jgi:glycine/sarcosine N-methyltransferase
MYDSLSSDYDRFVDWPARLAVELPLLEWQLASVGAHCVLDAACGTGRHAIELARRGFVPAAADPSAGMIARARAGAAAAKAAVRFEQAGFGELASAFGTESFDALLCLGNSLPHVQDSSELDAALDDFSACLKPGGLLILQNRNFDRILSGQDRWIEPQGRSEGGREWLFVRFYDFESDGSITFHILTLTREGGGWSQKASSTRLWPLLEENLAESLKGAGFEILRCFGSAAGEPFDRNGSPDLILVARKKI